MKRIYYFITLLFLAAAPMTFTSCDDDDPFYWDDNYWGNDWSEDNGYDKNDKTPLDVQMAQVLNGSWTGTVVNEYYDEDGKRVKTQCDVDFDFTQYTVNSNQGSGTETDYAPLYDNYGKPVYDENGKQMYESQTLKFKWNFDSRSYMLYLTYDSGMRFVIDTDPNKREFFLGYDEKEKWDFFEAVMNQVGGNERATIKCERVTQNRSAKSKAAQAGMAETQPNAAKLFFGKAVIAKQEAENVPFALRKR